MEAKIDRDACIGCELCVAMCSEVFQMDDEQIATVIVSPIPSELEDDTRDSADSCPTEAIIIEE